MKQETICYEWLNQRLILSVFKPCIRQRLQFQQYTVKPYVAVREFNVEACTAINVTE